MSVKNDANDGVIILVITPHLLVSITTLLLDYRSALLLTPLPESVRVYLEVRLFCAASNRLSKCQRAPSILVELPQGLADGGSN